MAALDPSPESPPVSHTMTDDGSGQIVVDENPDLLASSLETLRACRGDKLRSEGDGNRDDVLLRFLRADKVLATPQNVSLSMFVEG